MVNSKPDAQMIAIDPGEEHVGLAEFQRMPPDAWRKEHEWMCTWAGEMLPGAALEWVTGHLPLLSVVVYETWQIYPDKAATLIGSQCETAQFIGALKWIVLGFNKHSLFFPDTPPHPGFVGLIEQPAAIQIPTRSLLKQAGRKSMAKRIKAGEHAMSAELHGWCFLHRNGLVTL
jgi:hypothetical protein